MKGLTPEDELELKVAERTETLQIEVDTHKDRIKFLESEIDLLKGQLKYRREQHRDLKIQARLMKEAAEGNYWAWQEDGENHLESLTCPVMIDPQDLLKLVHQP